MAEHALSLAEPPAAATRLTGWPQQVLSRHTNTGRQSRKAAGLLEWRPRHCLSACLLMNITVNEELLAYIDPLTPEEHSALERSLLAEGCRDALVLWGEVLVDGHNRYGICSKHGIPFNTVQNSRFKSIADVHLWMIDQHLGRRSVSDFQRGVLALRKKAILAARVKPPVSEAPTPEPVASEPKVSRDAIAKEARVSSNAISQIEKIQKSAAPELAAGAGQPKTVTGGPHV